MKMSGEVLMGDDVLPYDGLKINYVLRSSGIKNIKIE